MKKMLISAGSRCIAARVKKQAAKACTHQQKTFHRLMRTAARTAFGNDHGFAQIKTYSQFKQQVPLNNYTELLPYIDRIRNGEKNVLWPGQPLYMAKTSGTTGGYKYIPLTRQSLPQHIKAARNALACYVAQTGKADFTDGKMLFLQGSPELEIINGLPTGRLSGIVAHYVPKYLLANRLPTYATNTLTDWNDKVNAIVRETLQADMRLFGGIPSWLQHYFEALLQASGKQNLAGIFPRLQVLVHGGVSYEPYRQKFETLFGRPVDVIETYPATEGFIAYQDSLHHQGLLLNTNAGMFFELVDMDTYHTGHPVRVSLDAVQLHKNYALVLNTNSGLFGYVIGDTVSFVSKDPYRLVVTGRIKEYVSAFGEQVYAHQTDAALKNTLALHAAVVNEYHVYPDMKTARPRHRWLIEFEERPADIDAFARELDRQMHGQNIFYRDIVLTGVIDALEIKAVPKKSFYAAMQKAGRLGEQNKVTRLANDDAFALFFETSA